MDIGWVVSQAKHGVLLKKHMTNVFRLCGEVYVKKL
jgi:hypothetical protein